VTGRLYASTSKRAWFLSLNVLALAVLICLGGALVAAQLYTFREPVSPTPETPAKRVSRVTWTSKWDNPVMQGPLVFRQDQFAKRPSWDAWEYFKFDLVGVTFGAVNNPSVTQSNTFYTWPRRIGTESGNGTETLWEMHGTRLSPRLTGAPNEGRTLIHALKKDWDLPIVQHGPTGAVQLDPAVALVPVHVLVLVPSGTPDGYPPEQSGWFPEAKVDAILDDVWDGDKGNTTNPGESPHDVVTIWNFNASCGGNQSSCTYPAVSNGYNEGIILPDRIFDRCDVQFRKANFHECIVPPGVFWNLLPTSQVEGAPGCKAAAQAQRVHDAVMECNKALLADSALTVVMVGGLISNAGDCYENVIEGYIPGTNLVIGTIDGMDYKTVLSHELGHGLGLDHTNEGLDTCPNPTLMCRHADEQTPFLNPAQCKTAHMSAKSRQDNFKWK
jgi:hypothetical protein